VLTKEKYLKKIYFYLIMIEKKDWISARDMLKNALVNDEITLEMHKSQLKTAEDKLKEFPEDKEDDPMPKEVKDIVEAVK
jgi:hypothetical protein